jgi:cardiolipin synthase C
VVRYYLLLALLFTQPGNISPGRQLQVPPANSQFPNNPSSIYRSLQLDYSRSESATGVLSLESGGQSLVTRLWLFEHAEKSIDIQYFSFARNITGLIACDYIVRAADKGLKVRLLIDEAAGRMNAREIKILDLHENIEVKVYNPGFKLGRLDKKIKYGLKNRDRLMQRMHSKTLNIDGEVVILGGRNISDEYFDFDHKLNFRDRDVLLMGRAARAAKRDFDRYWSDSLTVTCTELLGKSKKKFSVDALFEKLHRFAADTAYFSSRMRALVDSFPSTFRKSRHAGAFQWVNKVAFISDKPGKNEDRDKRKGGLCHDSVMSLIQSAKRSLDIATPYFITTKETRNILRETVARGVRVRILTNSMASIDNDVAFSPYKRDRKENLATGIELYEFRPDAAERFSLTIPEVQASLHYEPVFAYHAKSMIIDGRVCAIGSYNLDPLSANITTECMAVIRSPEITAHLARYFEEELKPENSWRITRDFNPDSKAPLKKKAKTTAGHVVPRGIL